MPEQPRDLDQRPSPEALLEAARREARVGRLKIFVGAAPGVGKTYEMLQQARARKRDGYDLSLASSRRMGARKLKRFLRDWRLSLVARSSTEGNGWRK